MELDQNCSYLLEHNTLSSITADSGRDYELELIMKKVTTFDGEVLECSAFQKVMTQPEGIPALKYIT